MSSVAQLAVGLNPSADYIVSAIDGSYLPGDSVYPTDGIPGVKCAPRRSSPCMPVSR